MGPYREGQGYLPSRLVTQLVLSAWSMKWNGRAIHLLPGVEGIESPAYPSREGLRRITTYLPDRGGGQGRPRNYLDMGNHPFILMLFANIKTQLKASLLTDHKIVKQGNTHVYYYYWCFSIFLIS